MTKEQIVANLTSLTMEDVAWVRTQIADILALKVGQAKADREASCDHLRAKESEYYAGMVTWHCPDCGATRRLSHHRERGAQ